MDLIDWRSVGFGALWIVGLSCNLTAFSLAEYQRSQTGQRLRDLWSRPGFQAASNLGWAAFCFGLIGSTRSAWESILWVVLGLAFLYFMWQAVQPSK